MSDAVAPETAKGDAPKGKGKLIPILIVAVVVLAGGGGGAYWYFSHSKAEAKSEDGEEKAGTTKGKAKGKAAEEEDAEHTEEEDTSEEEEPPKKSSGVSLRLPDDSKVKQIIELQPFIVNLADASEARYLRLVVSLGIGGEEEGESEKPDPLFTTRIRNAMLAVLTSRTSEEVLSNEGKAKLRRDLLRAARMAAKEAHVEAIYITEFIVQL